ncbi:PspC domain-containing protein [Streptomyces erythrogriseus]
MAATALVSLAVELLQTAVPGQVVDVDSLLLNTAGAALAHAAVVPAGRAWLRRRTLLPAADGAVRRRRPLRAGPRRFPGSGSPRGATFCPLRLRNVEVRRQPHGMPRTVHEGVAMSSLVRPTDDRMIGGVCAGLARRFGTSAKTMRVVFLVSCLLPGPQFLLYLALWILLPSEDKARTAW